MGTPLQKVYESFFIKTNEDFLYKEDQVFKYLTTAIGKSYKTVPNKLDFTLNKNESVITIFNTSEVDNEIYINLDNKNYTTTVLPSDTLVDIANNIKAELDTEYNVKLKILKYPRLIISSADQEVDCSISVYNDMGLDIEVSSSYDGEFTASLYFDEIELLSMFMQLEHYIKKKSEIESIRMHIGTKDFNRLPDKKLEYDNLNKAIDDLSLRIFRFRQEFHTYKGGAS